MTTPASEAIKGLVGAVRAIVGDGRKCLSCGLPPAQCELHPGYCKPTIEARAALSAFEERARLRDDASLVAAVHAAMQNAPHDGRDFRMARAALDAVESALLGTPGTTKETK